MTGDDTFCNSGCALINDETTCSTPGLQRRAKLERFLVGFPTLRWASVPLGWMGYLRIWPSSFKVSTTRARELAGAGSGLFCCSGNWRSLLGCMGIDNHRLRICGMHSPPARNVLAEQSRWSLRTREGLSVPGKWWHIETLDIAAPSCCCCGVEENAGNPRNLLRLRTRISDPTEYEFHPRALDLVWSCTCSLQMRA